MGLDDITVESWRVCYSLDWVLCHRGSAAFNSVVNLLLPQEIVQVVQMMLQPVTQLISVCIDYYITKTASPDSGVFAVGDVITYTD